MKTARSPASATALIAGDAAAAHPCQALFVPDSEIRLRPSESVCASIQSIRGGSARLAE